MSTESGGFPIRSPLGALAECGEIPKRPTGADCKSAGARLRGFKSSSPHHHMHMNDKRQPEVLRTRAPKREGPFGGLRALFRSRYTPWDAGIAQW